MKFGVIAEENTNLFIYHWATFPKVEYLRMVDAGINQGDS